MSYQRVILSICLVFLLLMINDVINLESTSQRDSDIVATALANATENREGHMYMLRLTSDEQLELNHEILKLSDKPKSPIDKDLLIKRSGPKFLYNVYKYIANKGGEKKLNESVELSEFNLTENDLRTINQSNDIITFMGKYSHLGVTGRPERISFDIHDIPVEDEIISAELRMYRGPDAKNSTYRGAFTVTVYQIMRGQDEREMEFVDSANTPAGHEGWITLKVTELLLHWLKHPDENRGLYLMVLPNINLPYDTRPEDIGIVGNEGDPKREPFMVGFFRRNESANATHI